MKKAQFPEIQKPQTSHPEIERRVEAPKNQDRISPGNHLYLVDDNKDFKRYQIIMTKRDQVNIHWKGSDRIQSNTNDGLTIPREKDQDYLRRSYGPDDFDPNVTNMVKGDTKVTVVRNGQEFQHEVLNRD